MNNSSYGGIDSRRSVACIYYVVDDVSGRRLELERLDSEVRAGWKESSTG